MSAASGFSDEQQLQAVKKIQELQQKKDDELRHGATDAYVDDVKQSMLFQPGFNWNDILGAAPTSIMLLGSLFVASTVPDALQIKVSAPASGFKYLASFPDVSLNACLVQCSDTGSQAFQVAGKSMDAISLRSSTIKQRIRDIIVLLGDRETAKTALKPTIINLKALAEACKGDAKKIELTFETWLSMVCELHACVVQSSSDISEKEAANQIQLAAAQTRLASAQTAQDQAKTTLETMRDTLKSVTEQYNKAADEFPSGWELIAREVVSNLSDCLTTAINQAVPALVENFSTTAKVEAAVQIFRGDHGGVSGGSTGDGKQDHSNVPAATQAPDPTPTALPPYASDPAYGIVGNIVTYVNNVMSFVTGGPDGGVDWDTLSSKDPNKQRDGLGVMIELLKHAQENFKPSSDPPSTDLTTVFTDVGKVTSGLDQVNTERKTIGGKAPPGPDSDQVKEWKVKIATAYTLATKLNTDAKNVTNAHSAPLVNKPTTTANPQDKKGALRQQIIDAATTKLNTAAEVMNTSSTNFQKASEQLVDVQKSIGEISGTLAELTASNMSLDKIKAILVKCIEILVQLKSKINRLNAFFESVSTLVAHVVDDQVDPFIDQLNAINPNPEKMLLNVSYTDFQRQMIFNFSLSIRAYFELFRDITSIYKQVHVQYIMPGLEIVNNLSTEYGTADPQSRDRILQQKQKVLSDYEKSAADGVKTLLMATQSTITQNLESNAQNAASDLDFVPVKPAEQVRQAIAASGDESKKAAQTGIDKSAVYITRPFSDTSSLLD